MRPQGTAIQLEVRRRVAVALLESGWGVRHVARHVKASPSSVRRWRDAVAQHAQAGLDAKPPLGGSQPKLSGLSNKFLNVLVVSLQFGSRIGL
jgi:transposase